MLETDIKTYRHELESVAVLHVVVIRGEQVMKRGSVRSSTCTHKDNNAPQAWTTHSNLYHMCIKSVSRICRRGRTMWANTDNVPCEVFTRSPTEDLKTDNQNPTIPANIKRCGSSSGRHHLSYENIIVSTKRQSDKRGKELNGFRMHPGQPAEATKSLTRLLQKVINSTTPKRSSTRSLQAGH